MVIHGGSAGFFGGAEFSGIGPPKNKTIFYVPDVVKVGVGIEFRHILRTSTFLYIYIYNIYIYNIYIYNYIYIYIFIYRPKLKHTHLPMDLLRKRNGNKKIPVG